MDPNTDPTPEPAPPSEDRPPRQPRAIKDTLPRLAKDINKAYETADREARKIGKALRKAKGQLGWAEWGAWLAENCPSLPEDTADHSLILAAEKGDLKAVVPTGQPTVICGWCLHDRAGLGRPPKHVSGPKGGEHPVHGICAECDQALIRKLELLRKVPPVAEGHYSDELGMSGHAADWSISCAKLKSAYLYVDQALEAVRALDQVVGNPALRNMLNDAGKLARESLHGLSLLTFELLLLGHEVDYDCRGFRPGSAE